MPTGVSRLRGLVAQQLGERLSMREVADDAFLEKMAELLEESGVFLGIALRFFLEELQEPAGQAPC